MMTSAHNRRCRCYRPRCVCQRRLRSARAREQRGRWEYGKTGGGDSKAGDRPPPEGLGYDAPEEEVFRLRVAKSRPKEAWAVRRRPDCRRFVCDRCRQAVYICSWCDRGHRYCTPECRDEARRHSLRGAGRRYQQTPRGRRLHARRQQAYRDRKQRGSKKVTHHSCRRGGVSATVASCPTTMLPSPLQAVPVGDRSRELLCGRCSHPCEPMIRHDFLRSRRARSVRRSAVSMSRRAGGTARSLAISESITRRSLESWRARG